MELIRHDIAPTEAAKLAWAKRQYIRDYGEPPHGKLWDEQDKYVRQAYLNLAAADIARYTTAGSGFTFIFEEEKVKC